ncbi:MAG: Gfo/Idh/MocA family oxidoreductase [Planctomycetota bacterium]
MGIKVGVVGLGMMGLTHLDAYAKLEGVEVAALADRDEDRLHGKTHASGNIEGQAEGGFDYASVKKYTDASELIADPGLDVVDICLPTPAHVPFGIKALEAGKHLLTEKPLARSYDDAMKLVDAAEASDKIAMCAMCMRFWPGWTWLKDVISDQRFGKLLSLSFRRVASHPQGPFYQDGEANGGAALDLHIHDADFVQFLFGLPRSVSSAGYSSKTTAVDHIATRYDVGTDALVRAEGSWAMADGYAFRMQYTANFERATAEFDSSAEQPLAVAQAGDNKPVELEGGMGYDHEIAYFIDCVRRNRQPEVVTMQDAANAVRLIEAEVQSAKKSGAAVPLG